MLFTVRKYQEAQETIADLQALLAQARGEIETLKGARRLRVSRKDDGFWLLIDAPSGRKGMYYLSGPSRPGSIITAVLDEVGED